MTLASAGRGRISLWGTVTGRLLVALRGYDFMTGLAFTPDGKHLAGELGERIWKRGGRAGVGPGNGPRHPHPPRIGRAGGQRLHSPKVNRLAALFTIGKLACGT